jgi:uncharacterized protein (DUF362 family)
MAEQYNVGIVRASEENLVESVSKLLEVMEAFRILDGKKKILIKPNFADVERDLPRRNGDQTSLEVLEALVHVLNEHIKPDEIIIGEGSASPTWRAFFEYGVYDFARKCNIRLIDLNYDEVVRLKPRGAFFMEEVFLPKTLFKVDAILSVPVLKIWPASAVSLSIKNYTGGILPSYWYHKYYKTQGICNIIAWGSHPRFNPDFMYGQSKTLAAGMTDILLSAPIPTLSIIDGLRCMHLKSQNAEFEFRYSSIRVDRRNLLIGGENIVAVDTVGTAVMGINPRKILHLEMATEKALGINDLNKISIRGEPLDNVRFTVTPPSSMREILY